MRTQTRGQRAAVRGRSHTSLKRPVTGGMGLVMIHFEDHGQDFLRWTVSSGGDVVACEPFQSSIWCKAEIINRADLQVGVQPVYKFPGVERPLTLKYKIIAIHDAFDVKAEEAVRRTTDVVCSDCSQPVAEVAACTCTRARPLVLRKATVKKGGRS